MDRHGVAEMFDIPGMACKKGTSRHPVSYNHIVIFIEALVEMICRTPRQNEMMKYLHYFIHFK